MRKFYRVVKAPCIEGASTIASTVNFTVYWKYAEALKCAEAMAIKNPGTTYVIMEALDGVCTKIAPVEVFSFRQEK